MMEKCQALLIVSLAGPGRDALFVFEKSDCDPDASRPGIRLLQSDEEIFSAMERQEYEWHVCRMYSEILEKTEKSRGNVLAMKGTGYEVGVYLAGMAFLKIEDRILDSMTRSGHHPAVCEVGLLDLKWEADILKLLEKAGYDREVRKICSELLKLKGKSDSEVRTFLKEAVKPQDAVKPLVLVKG